MVTAVAEDEARLTMEGVARGTPAFMPPELALGEANVDGRADLYSLGCVAYWLLTGHFLFDANSATRLLMHHVQTPPTPLSQLAEQDIPPRLEELVMSCLEKSPANRPASAMEIGEALEAIEFRTPWTQERARKWWTVHMPEVFRREPVRQTPV